MKVKEYCLLAIPALMLAACITTSVRDFTDPVYESFTATNLLLMTPNQEFDDIFLQTLHDKNIKIKATRFTDIFLPTRKYSNEEITKTLKEKKYDAAIYITIAGSQSSSQVVSYMSMSNAQAYSTGYGNAYATGTNTTIPITSHKRNTTSKAELLDPLTQRKIWVADLHTKASGAAYVQNDDTMESISEEVINSLIRKRHLIVKPSKEQKSTN